MSLFARVCLLVSRLSDIYTHARISYGGNASEGGLFNTGGKEREMAVLFSLKKVSREGEELGVKVSGWSGHK